MNPTDPNASAVTDRQALVSPVSAVDLGGASGYTTVIEVIFSIHTHELVDVDILAPEVATCQIMTVPTL